MANDSSVAPQGSPPTRHRTPSPTNDAFVNSPDKCGTAGARTRVQLLSIQQEGGAAGQNSTYQSHMRAYKRYIDKERLLARKLQDLNLQPGKYFSLEASNEFFVDEIASRDITSASAMKYLYAIHKLAILENSDIDDNTLYKRNTIIQDQIIIMNGRQNKKDKRAAAAGLIDDQAKMLSTDIVTPPQISQVNLHALNTNTWHIVCPKITTMFVCLVRHKSTLKINMGKFRIVRRSPDGSSSFPADGEEFKDQGEPVLAFVVPNYDQIKRNNTKQYTKRRTEVTGGFRNRRYELCYVGCLAMKILVDLNNRTVTDLLNFYEPLENEVEEEVDDNLDPENEENELRILNSLRNKNRSFRQYYPMDSGRRSTTIAIDNAFKGAGVPPWEKKTHFK